VVLTEGIFFGASIVAYFDPNSGFTIPGIILWTILDTLMFIEMYSLSCFGLILFTMTCTYIKYKYNDINDKIELSVKRGKHSLLKKAIIEHNIITKLVVKINEFYKFVLFDVYY